MPGFLFTFRRYLFFRIKYKQQKYKRPQNSPRWSEQKNAVRLLDDLNPRLIINDLQGADGWGDSVSFTTTFVNFFMYFEFWENMADKSSSNSR